MGTQGRYVAARKRFTNFSEVFNITIMSFKILISILFFTCPNSNLLPQLYFVNCWPYIWIKSIMVGNKPLSSK